MTIVLAILIGVAIGQFLSIEVDTRALAFITSAWSSVTLKAPAAKDRAIVAAKSIKATATKTIKAGASKGKAIAPSES